EHHEKQPFVKADYTYAHYAPAYRIDYEGFHKYPGKACEEIESDLALDYEKICCAHPSSQSYHLAGRAPLQKPLINAEDLVTCDDENHFVDFVVGREEFARCFHGNARCFPNRITVGAATDRREGNRLDSVFNGEQQ